MPTRSKRAGGRQLRLVVTALGWLASTAGCAEEITDPAPFYAARDGAVPAATCTLGIDVPTAIFAARCGTTGCHASTTPAGSLDLVSPGVAARLIGRPSTVCTGQVLASPSGSSGFLYEKLRGSPRCGSAMPLGAAPLMPAEIDCVRAWVESQAGGSSTMDGGGASDGGMDAPPEARAVIRRTDGAVPGEAARCA